MRAVPRWISLVLASDAGAGVRQRRRHHGGGLPDSSKLTKKRQILAAFLAASRLQAQVLSYGQTPVARVV